ncbi:hypothetical protein ISS08_00390 [Candidatus Pacearchaeota archaeon]|nr:hypothetical protein [Candidatus Pacearchaeota archaeon]
MANLRFYTENKAFLLIPGAYDFKTAGDIINVGSFLAREQWRFPTETEAAEMLDSQFERVCHGQKNTTASGDKRVAFWIDSGEIYFPRFKTTMPEYSQVKDVQEIPSGKKDLTHNLLLVRDKTLK